ncbi:MAG: methylmalonyl Co-A mutase-associated GTPase MeaB [Cyclobacteriaceae bacterium]|nr:methylmalonyl Co-A mutase-associated GTPase MeaB [Cyclobacteriaceae bacterium HetDA_MAG_MS6]
MIFRSNFSLEDYFEGIKSRNRVKLSQAITLIESRHPDDQRLGKQLTNKILPLAGKSIRLGITGVPGVGKSTFIECFGNHVIDQGHRIAVLSVDPSSTKSGGSILGDKTRMQTLSVNPDAFIRPSPARSNLGGVAHSTREAILLCEAAGFDVIVVETVGVGQSETLVRGMVDFFVLLTLAGGGDELQGIKRGIMEMTDLLLINKIEKENQKMGNLAAKEYANALHLLPPHPYKWKVPCFTCSSLTGSGISRVWDVLEEYQKQMQENGYWSENRKQQNLAWFDESLERAIKENLMNNAEIIEEIEQMKSKIAENMVQVSVAIEEVLEKIIRRL